MAPVLHKPEKLTLRVAFNEQFNSPRLKPRTVEAYKGACDHWERIPVTVPTDDPLRRKKGADPDLREIDSRTLAEFRDAMLATHAQNTVRKVLTHILSILNFIGPATSRHPDAIGLLQHVPLVRKPAEKHRKPRIADDDEMNRLYQACEIATWPVCEVDPILWWRCLLVVLFNVGLRRFDFLSLRWSEIDLRRGLIRFDAEKTGKSAELPLHPIVVQHLKMIETPRVLVFPWRRRQRDVESIDKKKTSLYRWWHQIQQAAGITTKIDLHDLRKTCGNGIYWHSPAAARELLQHASITTTQRSYASSASPITRELLLKREQPQSFTTPSKPDDDLPPTVRFPHKA